jgi:hypothetical protein
MANNSVRDESDEGQGEERPNPIVASDACQKREHEIRGNSTAGANSKT